MNTEIVKVNDTKIECPYENEQHYVAIRSICQALGIDHQKQFERIKTDPILKDVYTDTVYTSDKTGNRKQAMFCLPVKFVFGWIFSIDDTKVNEKAKPAFLKYKLECYNALYEHFFMKSALYEKKEQLISDKILTIEELQKQKEELDAKIKTEKRELETIRSTPATQLKLIFNN